MNTLLQIQHRLHDEKTPMQAVIREIDCIGCTKCLPACPVDAIVGAAKQMHSVIQSECIGCQLCVEPCPVDCIDMVAVEKSMYDPARVHERYQAQQRRLLASHKSTVSEETSLSNRINYIQEAVERVRKKRAGELSPTSHDLFAGSRK